MATSNNFQIDLPTREVKTKSTFGDNCIDDFSKKLVNQPFKKIIQNQSKLNLFRTKINI